MLCSRAITRERAAMSGSIAAFVLTIPYAASSFSQPTPHAGARVGTPIRSGTDTLHHR